MGGFYLFVKREYRGKGIGTSLYRKVEQYCRANEISEILIDVDEPNVQSKQFHSKMGFKPVVTIYSKKVM